MQVKTNSLLKTLVSFSAGLVLLNACASKPVTQVPGYETTYYDEQSSLAQNVLKLVYFNRYVSDATIPAKDWEMRQDDTPERNHFARESNTRSSMIYRQLRNGANVDATRPFDQPNVISWVPVDTFKGFGTEEFDTQVYILASQYLLSSLDADVESNFDDSNKAASVEFSGKSCEDIQSQLHPKKVRKGEWIGSGEDVTCFINFRHEIVRPVQPADWRPKQLNLDPSKQYVLVRSRIANFEAFLYGQRFDKSFVFYPHKRTTHKRGRSITAGKGTPFLQHKDEVFLFAKPYQQQEAVLPASFWVHGNKLP